jgi:putative endonuclease
MPIVPPISPMPPMSPMSPTKFNESRQWLGHEGETRAASFLEARGYRIVARNVRADRVEIDLIVRRQDTLVFVEVKSRRANRATGGHSLAAEAVDFRKQRRLRRGAHAWLAANPREARRARGRRFDVVTCLLEPGAGGPVAHEVPSATNEAQTKTTAPDVARWSIEHWEAAF